MNKAAVLGSPIAHSLSPIIHQCAYQVLGWDWSYERYEVKSGELPDFLSRHEGQFRGLSLTMPLKEEVLTLVDSLSDQARMTNSANTIVFDELGSTGFNTDIGGFQDALRAHEVAIPSEAAVLGGGATARSAIAALDGSAQRIHVFSRSAHRNKGLVNSATKSIVEIHPWENAEACANYSLIISTTPKGATDDLQIHNNSGVFFESLYNPWPTPLLKKWQEAGGVGIDGLDLLVWQALGQLEHMSFNPNEVRKRKFQLFTLMREQALLAL